MERELFGILGSLNDTSAALSWWNARFKDEGMDAAMTRYPTEDTQLQERLSEMFHFDRRGYIVGKGLTEAIIPLLDDIDATAKEKGSVDTVHNVNGVMTGYFCAGDKAQQWEILL